MKQGDPMTRYLMILALLPGCGLVRAVDQHARDAGQDAAIAETNVGVATAQRDTATNTTAILDLRDRIADTTEEHAEIARLRGENDARASAFDAKLRTAEANAKEFQARQEKAEAAVQDADENAWWRIALEVALAALGVSAAGGLALRWRGLAGRAIKALTEIGEKGIDAYLKARVLPVIGGTEVTPVAIASARNWLTDKYRAINDDYGVEDAVRKALGKPPRGKK